MGQHEDRNQTARPRRMYDEVWNKGNYGGAPTTPSHADFDDHPPTRFFDVGRIGPGALTEAAQEFLPRAIPDFHDTPELVLVEGDRAAYLGAISGKQTGEMFGFPPTGRRMRVWGINFFRAQGRRDHRALGPVRRADDDAAARPRARRRRRPRRPRRRAEYGDPRPRRPTTRRRHRSQQERLPPDGRGGRQQGQLRRRSPSSSTRTTSTTSRRPARRPASRASRPIFRMFRTGFPDVKFTIDQMIGEGDYVATLVHGEGTHTGQFIAVPAERQARRVALGRLLPHPGREDRRALGHPGPARPADPDRRHPAAARPRAPPASVEAQV